MLFYADDDIDDQLLLKEAFYSVDPAIDLKLFGNGLELYQHLDSQSAKALPECIILDLNMPFWDGLRTVQALKKHERYRGIPVFIFSTSRRALDRSVTLEAGAEDFFTKPDSPKELRKTVERFIEICRKPDNESR